MEKLIDKSGRRINYLRLSITEKCNLKCIYCSRYVQSDERKIGFMTPEEIERIVHIFQKIDRVKIRLTGGEPLLRSDIVEITKRLSKFHSVDSFLTTNGILLKRYAQLLKDAGLKRINISLDSLKEDVFKRITSGGNIKDVIEGIYQAKMVGFEPIKLNVVLLRGINDGEINSFIDFGERMGIIIRFIEVMPLGMKHWKRYFVSNDELISRLKGLFDKRYPIISDGPARYYKLKNGMEVGFISPISHNFCDTCSRLRITSDGFLRTCLVNGREYNLIGLLREGGSDDEIIEFLRKAIEEKQGCGDYSDITHFRPMVEIGG